MDFLGVGGLLLVFVWFGFGVGFFLVRFFLN